MKNLSFILNPSHVLKTYEKADVVAQLKARFIYYMILAAMAVFLFMAIAMGHLQMTSDFHGALYLPVLLPLLTAFVLSLGSMIVLLKGHYLYAANMLLITSLLTVWFILFVSKGTSISRLDTIVWVYAGLGMLPLIMGNRKRQAVLYVTINLAILLVFLLYNRHNLFTTDYEFHDFLLNSSIALIFVGFVGYNIYSINQAALKKAQSDLARRKRIEDALRASEARYKDLFDSMPNGFYRSTPEGYFVDANPAFVKMLGYESLGELKKVYIPTDLYVHESEREEITRGTEFNEQMITFRQKTKDGRIIWLEENARFIKDENGKVIYHEGICRDITDRKQAIEALKESEADLKAIIENSFESIWSINKKYEIKYVNRVFAREFKQAFGVKLQKGTNLLMALPASLRDLWKTRYDRILKNEHFAFEDRVDFQGGEIYIDVSASPIVMDDEVRGACFFGRNVTDKKLAEHELKQSKELFETLFEAAPVSISLIGENGKYLQVNKAFANEMQVDEQQIIGKTPREIGLEFDDKSREHIAAQLKDKGFVKGVEVKMLSPGGQYIDAYYSGNTVRIVGNDYVLSTSLNVTEKKRIEKELENYKNHLEHLVKERTEELMSANEELKTANEELFEKNEIITAQKRELEQTLATLKELQVKLVQSEKMASLGIFTAGVAHEINNPINFIANGTAALENFIREEFPDSIQELKPLFDAINTGVKRVTTIVRSMSKYNRSEEIPASHCNIHDIIDDTLSLLYNQYKSRIQVIKNYTLTSPLVFANEGQLHQVFLNILANAIQAISGEGKIEVETHTDENSLYIAITDNGSGIDPEQIKHIFDPFYTTKAPGQGTGLGLSISQRIITDHGGTIQCKSVLNEGTTFTVQLPITS